MKQRILGFVRGALARGRRKRLLVVMAGAAIVSVAIFASAGAAPLAGSSFDTGNGTLTDTVDHDWNPPGQPAGNVGPLQPIVCPATAPGAGTNCGLDRTNSSLDDSFTQGPKEDDEAPVVGDGSIPPNKDDLARFYVNQEKAGGDDFLYLAWERTNTLGSAHMDFEFNQSNVNSANGVTKVRTAGDMLITFDFGGSGQPVLSLSRWITAASGGSVSDCEAANSLPCWDALEDLTASGVANGSVNSTNVIDNNPPGAPRTLLGSVSNNGSVSSTFGEAGINLTDAGVFQPNVCAHFGAASLKSRSSGQSFTSSLKDFIAPIPVNIANCGQVIIRKQTIPDEDPNTTEFGYTKSFPTDPASSNTFTLKDDGVQTYPGVFIGNGYTVTEDVIPQGWEFVSVDCSASTGVTPTDITGPLVTFNIDDPADVLDCTYTNRQQLGAILVTKTRKHAADGPGDHPHAGVSFTVDGVTKQTDANGEACFDGLDFGTYTVTETVPDGYSSDDASQDVTVDNNATCADDPFTGETVEFHNTPLTDITVSVDSQVDGGTSSTIDCDSGVPDAGPGGDLSTTGADLPPGTYTCTVVVDP